MHTHSARTRCTPRAEHLCSGRSQTKSMHEQWGAASDHPSVPQGQERDIPGCPSSPSCPQGQEIAVTSSTFSQERSHCHPATRRVSSQEHQDHPWWLLAREGQRWDSPLQPRWAGFLSSSSWISLFPTLPAMEDLLQPFLGRCQVGNAPAGTSQCPGCAACHSLVLFSERRRK